MSPRGRQERLETRSWQLWMTWQPRPSTQRRSSRPVHARDALERVGVLVEERAIPPNVEGDDRAVSLRTRVGRLVLEDARVAVQHPAGDVVLLAEANDHAHGDARATPPVVLEGCLADFVAELAEDVVHAFFHVAQIVHLLPLVVVGMADAGPAAGGELRCHAPRAVVVMVLESLGAESVLHVEAIRNHVNATQGTIQDDLRG